MKLSLNANCFHVQKVSECCELCEWLHREGVKAQLDDEQDVLCREAWGPFSLLETHLGLGKVWSSWLRLSVRRSRTQLQT